MNKKVIKAMYDYIVSKDHIRPILMGVHFEKERCYATDTHILAVYKYGSEKFDGQTVSVNGEKIKGNYPAIDRIIPKKLINAERLRPQHSLPLPNALSVQPHRRTRLSDVLPER